MFQAHPEAGQGQWRSGFTNYRRSMSTVSLDPKVKSKLVIDIDQFLHCNAQTWYINVGRPYRRGYLLYGPPGCGKTSFAIAVASEYKLDIHTLSLSAPCMNDESLYDLFSAINKKGYLILIEDIDCYNVVLDRVHRQKQAEAKAKAEAEKRKQKKKGKARTKAEKETKAKQKLLLEALPKVTLSGLLNVLDGAEAPEGNIVIMTCNYPQHLDKALTRKGRIDIIAKLGNACREQIKEIFMKIYEPIREQDAEVYNRQEVEALAEQFASIIPARKLPACEIQAYLITHKNAPHKAVDRADRWQRKVMKERKAAGYAIDTDSEGCYADDEDELDERGSTVHDMGDVGDGVEKIMVDGYGCDTHDLTHDIDEGEISQYSNDSIEDDSDDSFTSEEAEIARTW